MGRIQSTIKSQSFLIGSGLAIASFLILLGIHGKVMLQPNNYFLSNAGEGMRNYFVLASHVNNDPGHTETVSMNYPYGEHMVYTDGVPLFSNTFKFLVGIFPGLKDYHAGFLNIISLYSLIVCALLLYTLLLRFNIPPWYAAVFGLAMMLLSPQISRMPWHPGLALSILVPIAFHLYLSYYRKRNWKNTTAILVVNSLWFLVQPYMGLMSCAFFFFINLLLFIRVKNVRKSLKFHLRSLAQWALPALLFFIYLKATDSHPARVETPEGLLPFSSQFNTIFASVESPLNGFYALFTDLQSAYDHWEGWSYVGLSATLLMFFFLGRWLFSKFKKQALLPELNPEIQLLLWAGCGMLFIGMALPFKWWDGFRDVLDLVEPLKQFRALGRFSWFFFFGLNVFLFVRLYAVVKSREGNMKIAGLTLLVLLACFSGFEGSFLHLSAAKNGDRPNTLVMDKLSADGTFGYLQTPLKTIDFSQYQAVVPLPFFHVGSYLFQQKSNTPPNFLVEFMTFAYHSKLPMTSSYMSRTAHEESVRSLQFFSPSILEKEISKDITDPRPFLCFRRKGIAISEEEQRILQLGDPVYETDKLLLVAVMPEAIWKTDREAYIKALADFPDRYQTNGDLRIYANGPIVFKHFDDAYGKAFIGDGAFTGSPEVPFYFFDQQLDAPEIAGGTYALSYWFNHTGDKAHSKLHIDQVNKSTGEVDTTIAYHDINRTFTFVGDWMRCQLELEFSATHDLRLYYRSDYHDEEILIDELLLAPPKSSIYYVVGEDKLTWNNYPLFDLE